MATEVLMPARERLRPRGILRAVIPVALCLAIVVVIVFPLLRTLFTLFVTNGKVDLAPVLAAYSLPGIGVTILNTVILVVVGGGIALVLAAVLAWINERTDARIGFLSRALPSIPVLIPPIALVIGWVLLLAPTAGSVNVAIRHIFSLDATTGPLNIYSWPGLIFLYALELFPYAYLGISAALRNLDPALEEASRISGASALTTLRRVTLPAIRPALGAAALLIVVLGFALFAAASVVGGTARIDVLSSRIVELLRGVYPPQTANAIALSLVVVIVVVVSATLQRRLLGRGHFATVGGKSARTTLARLGPWKWPARVFMAVYLVLALVAPLLALLYVSLQPFWIAQFRFDTLTVNAYQTALFQGGQAQQAVLDSMLLGFVGATIGISIAVFVAMQLRRRRRNWIVRAAGTAVKLPGALSYVVIALGILVAYGGAPFLLNGTLAILMIGYITIYLPQASITAEASLSQVSDELIEASQISGAREGRTLRRVWIPLMLPGLAGGWVLLFAMISGDLTASVLLSGTDTPTVGSTLLQQYESGSFPQIAALALTITVVSSAIVLTVLALTRRGAPITR